jgi:YVTN family beta-propeller protein
MQCLASEILSWKAKQSVKYKWKGKTMLRSVSITTCILLTAALLYSADQSKVPQGYVLVANKLGKSLSIIDPQAGVQVAEVPVTGLNPNEDERSVPHEVAVSPDHKTAWVPIYSDSGMGGEGTNGRSVTIVDLKERKAIGYVDFGKPMRPHTPLFGPDGLLYVTAEHDESLAIIDTKARKLVGTIPTGGMPHFILFSSDGKLLYVIHEKKEILVIDVKAKKILRSIPVGEDIMRLVRTPDDRYLFTSDMTQPRVAVIDTKTDKVTRWIPLPSLSYGLATSPDGKWLLCGLPMVGQVAVVDLSKFEVVKTIDALRTTYLLLFRPDSQQAYVSTGASRAVGIIDVKEWKVLKWVRVGMVADHMEWAPFPK